MYGFIRLWFTDILGMLKSFAISIDELEGALDEGMGFDGSSIEGFARIERKRYGGEDLTPRYFFQILRRGARRSNITPSHVCFVTF